MPIISTAYYEEDRRLDIITLEKPDHGWGPFATWEVDGLMVDHVGEHLGLKVVYKPGETVLVKREE